MSNERSQKSFVRPHRKSYCASLVEKIKERKADDKTKKKKKDGENRRSPDLHPHYRIVILYMQLGNPRKGV
jgi:hypothetical protein